MQSYTAVVFKYKQLSCLSGCSYILACPIYKNKIPLQNSGHSILCPWIQQFSTNFPGYAASRMECNNPGNGNQISSFKVPEFTGKFVVILSKRMLVIC